jgi:putative tricarboxylic transport membrane protein
MTDQVTDRDDARVREDARVSASGLARGFARGLPWRIGARWGGILVAAALAVTGAIFVWQASLLDLGRIGLPGPGFFPLLLGALVVLFSIMIGIECWRAKADGEPAELGHPPVLITLAALLAVPLLFEWLGAYVTLGLFTAALLIFTARLSPLLAVLWSVLGMAACWLVFEELLGVRLPPMGLF